MQVLYKILRKLQVKTWLKLLNNNDNAKKKRKSPVFMNLVEIISRKYL